jgi:hypothetical protein
MILMIMMMKERIKGRKYGKIKEQGNKRERKEETTEHKRYMINVQIHPEDGNCSVC